eukprot:3972340-Amphidinium_carterae.1
MQVSDVAMTKLQNVEAHNGLEAWRQLALEFEPRIAGRRRLHLTNLPRPAKTNNMEKLVRDYKKVCKRALDEEIKIGVLAYLAPGKVSEHLFLFVDKLLAYAEAHKAAIELINAHRTQYAAGAAFPMDLDALNQKGGKGKDGKGRECWSFLWQHRTQERKANQRLVLPQQWAVVWASSRWERK